MHQGIMVAPTADANHPRFEKVEMTGVQLAWEFLEQENPENFLFEYTSGEELVGNLNKEFEPMLVEDFAARLACEGPQLIGVPAARRNLFFEKPLHAACVPGRAIAPDLGSDRTGDFPGA
jgi:hypothetical protein